MQSQGNNFKNSKIDSDKTHAIAVFSLLKIGLITILLSFVVIANIFSPDPELLKTHMQWAVLGLVAIAYFLVVFTAITIKFRLFPSNKFFGVILFLDFLISGILIHFTGGVISPYSILLLLPVIGSTIIYSNLISAYFSFLAISIYFSVSILGWFQILPIIEGQMLLPYELNSIDLIQRLSLNASAFLGVSILSILLSNRLAHYQKDLKIIEKEISDLHFIHRDILDSIDVGIITLDINGIIMAFNKASQLLLPENIELKTPISSINSELNELFLNKNSLDLTIHDGDKLKYLDASIVELKDQENHKRGFILVLIDKTLQTILENRSIQEKKMAALGRLSAGIAHEIRNPLTSISGSVELVRREFISLSNEQNINQFKDILELIDITSHEITRLNTLISDLLFYTRENKKKLMEVNLSDFISEIVKLFKLNRNTGNVKILTDLDPSFTCFLEPDSMHQVIINLLLNSIEAKGVSLLTIGVKPSKLDNYSTSITIEDNGNGIDPEIKDKIFEPFFTEKESGTGLGLAIVSKIIESHKGIIKVDSTPAKGTTFNIFLP